MTEAGKIAQNGHSTADDKSATESLINDHAGLVYGLAKRFSGRGCEPAEIIQSGFVGLAYAASRFNSSKGASFPSYAFKFVEGAMREFVRSDRLIRVPRSEYSKVSEAYSKSGIEGIETNGSELVEKAFKAELMLKPISLDAALRSDEENSAAGKELAVSVGFEEECISAAFMREALDRLETLERSVIVLRFYVEKTQAETAETLRISQSTVSRYEKSALFKLRRFIEN